MNKKLKLYLNENGLRFNLNKQRIWKYIGEIFGENRARELSDIFEETYIEKGKAKDVNRKYQFCKSFEDATTLMYFQSDWLFKNSLKAGELKARRAEELPTVASSRCSTSAESFSAAFDGSIRLRL